MGDEYIMFEFLENDSSNRNDMRIERRRLRENYDPFTSLDEVQFVKRYRLSKELVHNLCDELRPHTAALKKASDLSLETKVLVALSFYATGSYQRPVGDIAAHCIAQPTVSVILKQITNLLNLPHMRAKYIRFPRTSQERRNNTIRFFNKFGMPGVLGCIDCTHVAIVRPKEFEERFYCRKQYHSLNVQLITNADMDIISVDASYGGATHDSFIWANHPIKEHMEEIHRSESVWLLGDSGYPLRKYLLTPVTGSVPDSPEAHYTSVHVQTRNIIERTIGLLKARFRCLLVHRVLHYAPQVAANIVNACVVLHNMCNKANMPIEVLTEEEVMQEASRQIQVGPYLTNDTEASSSTSSNRELTEGLAVRSSLISRLWTTRHPVN